MAVHDLDVRSQHTLFVDGAVDGGELTLADVLDFLLVLELELVERVFLFAVCEDEIQCVFSDILNLCGGDDLLALVLVCVVVERYISGLFKALRDNIVNAFLFGSSSGESCGGDGSGCGLCRGCGNGCFSFFRLNLFRTLRHENKYTGDDNSRDDYACNYPDPPFFVPSS